MIEIDGQFGEGGGQILRSALSLSMVTNTPVSIDNVRKRRSRPGLLRQHLTAVNAAQEISGAEARGAELRSERLVFSPKQVKHGEYCFSVGTAGSATLVLQTLLPALLVADGASRLTLEGGTHNPMAPSFDFLQHSFFPLLRKMGAQLHAELLSPGFYPAGGGRFVVELEGGHPLRPLALSERGELRRTLLEAKLAQLPKHIGARELAVLGLRLAHLDPATRCIHVESQGPGNTLNAYLTYDAFTQTIVGFGEKRVSAERVANGVAAAVLQYLASGAVADEFLADQLLLPLALAGGGHFTTSAPSLHFTTNVEVIQRFLPVQVNVREARPSYAVDVSAG